MKLLGIEASRGFAALLVVTVHASRLLAGPRYAGAVPFGGLFTFGHAGVDFFFVLSGFIITYVHGADVGRPARFETYARKRLTRIYPTYWVALAIMLGLMVVSPTPDGAEHQLGNLVTSILLLPWPTDPLLGVAWSLKHEMLFYLLFGVLVLHRRAGQVVLAAWGALTVLNVACTWASGTPLFHGLWGSLVFRIFNAEFFFGIAVAALVRRGWIRRPWGAAVIGLVLFLGSGLYESFGPLRPIEWPPRHLAYAAGAALMLYGLAGAELGGRLRTPRPLVILGSASYSLYLVHAIVVLFIRQAAHVVQPHLALPAEAWFLIAVVSAVAAGLLFWRYIEQPMLARLQPARRRPVALGAAP
jgi:exopolysaccharide production protein ExoZ